jgi:hypothetical protein
MSTTFLRRLIGKCAMIATPLLASLHLTHAAGEIQIPLVKTTMTEYRDVKLFKRTPSHLSFRHSLGAAVIKISDIDPESITAVERAIAGLPIEADAPGTATVEAKPKPANPPAKGAAWESLLREQIQKIATLLPAKGGLGVFFGLLGALWLLHSLLCSMICKKAGHSGGLLVWLPILQAIPMFRAAGMSGWWLLGMCIPLVNLIGAILWCVKICEARGKGFFTIICLILPPTSLLALLYLALSNGHKESVEAPHAMRTTRALALG